VLASTAHWEIASTSEQWPGKFVIAVYRSFTALDRADRRLVLEAAVLIAIAWTGLRLLKFATLRRTLDRFAGSPASAGSGRSHAALIDRVGWAITAIARRCPAATCLVQALAADTILRCRGVACELRIGVRAGDNCARPIEAHAWVDCGGAVAVGAIDDLTDFKVLATLGPL
jgi:Transglutaminase-like superfamily